MIENLLELNKYKIKIKICILKKWCYNSIRFRGVAQSGRVLGLGPRCRRFESFRPDQKIQTVAFAAVLIFCLERTDSNDKILLSGSNLSLGFTQNAPNLRGIPDNLPAFGTWQIYSLSPRPDFF